MAIPHKGWRFAIEKSRNNEEKMPSSIEIETLITTDENDEEFCRLFIIFSCETLLVPISRVIIQYGMPQRMHF